MKKRFYVLSLSSFIISAILFVTNYFFYHYTGDDRANGVAFMFTPYHDEVRKPFITDLIGQLATIMLATAIVALLIAVIFYKADKKIKAEADEIRELAAEGHVESEEEFQ